MLEDIYAFGKLHDHVHVMFHQDHPNAFIPQRGDPVHHERALPGIESPGRFIQEKNEGGECNRSRHFEHFLLKERELLDGQMGFVLKSDTLQKLHGARSELFFLGSFRWRTEAGGNETGAALLMETEEQVIEHREISECLHSLESAAYPAHRRLMRRQSRYVAALKFYGSRIRSKQSGDHVEYGGFSRPVGSNERHYLSARNFDIDFAQRLQASKGK